MHTWADRRGEHGSSPDLVDEGAANGVSRISRDTTRRGHAILASTMLPTDIPHYTSPTSRHTTQGGIVYLITHMPTAKQYVGMTRRSLHTRWKQHVLDAQAFACRHPLSLHAAMRSALQAEFTVQVIDTGKGRNELRRKEAAWIARLRTNTPHGFNLLD